MRNKIGMAVLRISLGVVFLIFGIGKFQGDIWAQTIKSMDFFINLPWDTGLSVLLIGISETAVGIALIFGIFMRVFAAIAALQLMGILILLKFQEIRDIGLMGAAIYMALVEDDPYGIGAVLKKRSSIKKE